ncbi:MAG TPA: hypothetical protein VGM05_10140 [Planctomycetaceae bacterium]
MHNAWLPAVIVIALLGLASIPALNGSQKLVRSGISNGTDAISTAVTVATNTTKEDDDEREDDNKKGKGGKKEEEQEVTIKFADAPAAVQKTMKREASGAEIKHVEKETEDGKTTYETEVKIDGQDYTIKVAADGTLLEKELEDEDDEVPVKFADAPAAVQKTLQREAAGANIEKVDKLFREGRTLYEADAKIDGKNYEIIVTAEGLLLSKELDDEEEED